MPKSTTRRKPALAFQPATPDRWSDVRTLFGPRGACGGCWCMWPRLPSAEYKRGLGEGNRRRLQKLVASGAEPGIIAYVGDEPVGWCAVAPREEYARLATSKVMAPIDDRPVWSVVCFFVTKEWRGRGITVQLLDAVARHAAAHGATLLEGYPTAAKSRQSAAFVWTGLASAFEAAGFDEVARRSPTRPIFRRALRARRQKPPSGRRTRG